MKKIKVIRKHINEDDAATQQQLAQPANQQTANNQPLQQAQQPQQNTQQPANQQQLNTIDLNAAAANVNKFIGTLYQTIQNTVKDNLVKSCPEVDAMSKDQQSPLKDAVKKLNDSFLAFTKNPVKIDDAKNVADTITAFTTFISSLTEFNTNLANEAQKTGDQQQPNNAANNNQNQQALPAQNNAAAPQTANQQPAQNQTAPAQQQPNVNASYDTSNFGKVLQEKIRLANYERQMWRNL